MYMKEFLNDIPKDNERSDLQIVMLEKWMKTHLITDLDEFGVWEDNYEKFFHERAKVVSSELQKRIIKQDIDKETQLTLIDDYEEIELE